MQYGINAVAIVFNDNAYGNVLRAQMEEFDGHVLGTRLHNPDFVALAHSFGAHGVRAEDANALQRALEKAVATENGTPTLIEVPVGMLEREFKGGLIMKASPELSIRCSRIVRKLIVKSCTSIFCVYFLSPVS